MSCSNKEVILSPSDSQTQYDFTNLEFEAEMKTPVSRLFKNADSNSSDEDSEPVKDTNLGKVEINKVNENKRDRHSSGKSNKNKGGKKPRN